MPSNIFLDKAWLDNHLRKVRNRAGNRYTPKLNVDLPISDIFNGLSRTTEFYTSIRANHGKLLREFGFVSSNYDVEDLTRLYRQFSRDVRRLSTLLSRIKDYNTKPISWEQIRKQVSATQRSTWTLRDGLGDERQKDKNNDHEDDSASRRGRSEKYNSDIHHLLEIQKQLSYFDDLSASTKAELSNRPFLLLKGEAGTGKTHLLCDIIEKRFSRDTPMPGILVFGEYFSKQRQPSEHIAKQLGVNMTSQQLLRTLNSAGRQTRCRAILFIDALNEARPITYWKRHLNKITAELKKYPHIALVVSVRSGFESEVTTKNQREFFVHETHQGFQFREWEAVHTFFQEFNLPLPEIPLLMPEFQNPLFLLLFCKAFEHRAKRGTKQRARQTFRGHEGATYIFESFVDSVSKRIAKEFSISTAPGRNVWDKVIEPIAQLMVEMTTDRIDEDRVLELMSKAYPSIDQGRLLTTLDKNLILVRVPRSMREEDTGNADFRFAFQKFSDHLIGRYLFKSYESEFGKHNKNIQTAKRFFSRRRKLGKSLFHSWNRGVVEALSIQCPEHLAGIEFVEVAPYLRDSYLAKDTFIQSLIWRRPDAFTDDLSNTLSYINTQVIRTTDKHHELLDAFLSVACVPNHPFNADFLHAHLSKQRMPRRDAWWSVFLHYEQGERRAVDRLVEWGWSHADKSHIDDETIRLCCVALAWFLTSSNRFLRDKATKALVSLLSGRLHVVLRVLQQFRVVNDPYVRERLYAVAYGCALRTKYDKAGLRKLAGWIYATMFKDETAPTHILMRDYARGVVEVALQYTSLQISKKRVQPPYKSTWPKRIPSEKTLKKKYYPEDFFNDKTNDRGFLDIWSSVMHDFDGFGDFGRYVLNSQLDNWSGRGLRSNDPNLHVLFESFKGQLSSEQADLLEHAMSMHRRINFTTSMLEEEDTGGKIASHAQENAYDNFTSSLSKKQRAFFEKQIQPSLSVFGGINDPLDDFDTGLAQRWVFDRVVELGWSPTLHGNFDSTVNYNDPGRSAHKAERIGKKYQWIAFHELLARVADNFEFKGDEPEHSNGYEGTWQLNVRDIDPSCVLKNGPNPGPKEVPTLHRHARNAKYSAWDESPSNVDWLTKTADLPSPKLSIQIVDDTGTEWVALEGYSRWEQDIPPEHERFHLPTKRLWYMVKSYLIKRKDKQAVIEWLRRQGFMGRWMPESHPFYNVYLGEYPWALAFIHHNIPYYSRDGWTTGGRRERIPAPVLVTDDEYRSSGSSIDCSTEEPIGVKLPAKYLVDEMSLDQRYVDGRFFDSEGTLVAFDPRVFDATEPDRVLMRRDKLEQWLDKNGYCIVWTVLGEKLITGSLTRVRHEGRLQINAVYTLDEKKGVTGSVRRRFMAHH